MAIRLEGEPYRVIAADYHGGGGKMGGVTHARLRSLRTGTFRDWRFRADETVEQLDLERQTMQYLYGDAEVSHFMNPLTFEQVDLETSRIGPTAAYLAEGMSVWVDMLAGEPVGVVFPDHIELDVQDTAPPAHSQATDNVWKQAWLENGITVMVPPFIASGDRIRVDVEAGKYVGRVKDDKKK